MNAITPIEGAGESAGLTIDERIAAKQQVLASMIRGLDYAFLQVREFHLSFDHPVADQPSLMDAERVAIRAKWMREELDEFEDPEKQTVVDQADAMLDLIYFALGTLVEIGVLPQSLFDIVQTANMSKLHEIDGVMKVVKNELGKVIKPECWVAPEPLLSAEVHLQAKRGLLSLIGA